MGKKDTRAAGPIEKKFVERNMPKAKQELPYDGPFETERKAPSLFYCIGIYFANFHFY